MKTINELDNLICELIKLYESNEEEIRIKGSRYASYLINENVKIRKKASFYNDMRLYLINKPTEESIINQLNKTEHGLNVAKQRLSDCIGNINRMLISDFEKEKLIQQTKSTHEHDYSMRKLKKQISNLKFLLS